MKAPAFADDATLQGFLQEAEDYRQSAVVVVTHDAPDVRRLTPVRGLTPGTPADRKPRSR